jgi:hypothetical protein
MSAPGRAKAECRSAQHEGGPVSARPERRGLSAGEMRAILLESVQAFARGAPHDDAMTGVPVKHEARQ